MIARPGQVHLVGAGPGDPELITARGARLLRDADVIVFDRLVSPALLELARPDAERIDAGKAPGNVAMTQESINATIVDRARRGLSVVRLKGGDPFVFGRGFEELVACRDAGIACTVVPGVTSAIAGPASAGIPVTARGIARSFAVVTARSGDDVDAAELDFDALARLDTLVVLMGRDRLHDLSARLIAAGKPTDTPAAMVERATWSGQRTVVATLATIARAADDAAIEAPAVLVVGPTAAFANDDRFPRTLARVRVLVTRPRSASRGLVAALRLRGADVVECPLIRVEYPEPAPAPLDPRRFDWIVLTSLHGVRGFWRALVAHGLDARALAGPRIAAVGAKTAAELRDVARVNADLVPEEYRAAALLKAMEQHVVPGERVLFPCGTLARDEIAEGLRARGANVTELVVYDTLPQAPSAATRARIGAGLDAILLYSPSAARSLAEHDVDFGGAAIVCVGPTTADAVQALRLGAPIVPHEYGDAGVIAALESLVASRAIGARP